MENSEFKVKKFENGCELVFGVPNMFPSTTFEMDDEGMEITYDGYNKFLLQIIKEFYNFTTVFNPFFPRTNKYLFKNKKVDLLLLKGGYNTIYLQLMFDPDDTGNEGMPFHTQPYIFEDIYLAAPPGEAISGYEKLLLPFDSDVWILVLLTFALSFATIFIVNLFKASVRNFVFGRDVNSPSLNVAIIFFGLSLTRTPGRNFARFLTMLFILYSLIIRTCWQGKMFEMLKKDLNKPGPRSIEELIERNFTFYVLPDFRHFHRNFEKG